MSWSTAIRQAALRGADRSDRATSSPRSASELAITEERYRPGRRGVARRAEPARARRADRGHAAAAARASGRRPAICSRCYWASRPRRTEIPPVRLAELAPAGGAAAAHAVRARPAAPRHPRERSAAAQGERERGRRDRGPISEARHLRWVLVEPAQLSAIVLGSGINVWSIGINLLQPLLPRRRAAGAQAGGRGGLRAGAAAYRQTVLQGLQNVADVLRSLEAGRADAEPRAPSRRRGPRTPTGSRSSASRRAASASSRCSTPSGSVCRPGRAAAGARRAGISTPRRCSRRWAVAGRAPRSRFRDAEIADAASVRGPSGGFPVDPGAFSPL